MSIGMDSGWFSTFMDAYFDSFAATDLAIWRVFKETPGQSSTPISDEQHWHTAWEQIEALRAQDGEAHYGCSHSITYGRRAAS